MCVYLYKDIEIKIGRMKNFKVSKLFGINLTTYLVLRSLKSFPENHKSLKIQVS